MSQFTELTQRGLVVLSGADRTVFLQGLTSNDVTLATASSAIYSTILSPQGKFLFDFFVRATENSLDLECEKVRADELIARLKPYKLRSDVALANRSAEFAVLALDGPPPANLQPAVAYADPRLAALGSRVVVPLSWLPDTKAKLLAAGFTEADEPTYDLKRLQLGVPDGSRDIPVGSGILLDHNLHLLNAISWTKGCYMGQELTARTHYRALIKKSLLPVGASAALVTGTPITTADGQEVGELRSTHGPNALAMLRLDALEQPLFVGTLPLAVNPPEWWKEAHHD